MASGVDQGVRLIHSRLVLATSVAGVVLFTGIVIVSNVLSNETTTIVTTGVFATLALASLYLVGLYVRERHVLYEDHLDVGRLLRSRFDLAWADVTEVRYTPRSGRFVVRNRAGDETPVSATMRGISSFAAAALAHIDTLAIDPDARVMLETIAAGGSPFDHESPADES